mmetsp:Transcript_26698/g.30873  ORF Transcript_26698/g.30873 Transcript_26698/m.30873 type:complete len:430 (+) Transcript_26698:44-1333(+)
MDQTEQSSLLNKPESPTLSHYSPNSKPFALYSSLPYYSTAILYCIIFTSSIYFSNIWFVVWIIFGLLPVLDFLIPEDWLNPTKQQEKDLEDRIAFKIPLYLTVMCDWLLFLYAIKRLYTAPQFDAIDWVGHVFAVSISSAINFMTAHELFHKQDFAGKFVGCVSMIKSFYMHFYIEHLYGHHRNVGTPKDPATSRFNESFYQFLPRTVIGTWKSAWNYEKRRLLEIESLSTHWSPQNRMLWFAASYAAMPVACYLYGGITGLLVLFISGTVSFIYLEGINYIEHYGLERKQIGVDLWEKVDIRHSWNAPHRMTNYFLFKLQRHSDHHENSYKPYQTLCSYDQSPQLPNGYALCVMVIFYPKLWFSVMNPIVDYYKKGIKPDPKVLSQGKKAMWNYTFFMFGFFGLMTFIQFTRVSNLPFNLTNLRAMLN